MNFHTLCLIISLSVTYSVAKVHYKVAAVEKMQSDLGEGPHWDEKQHVLWHTDINEFKVCRLNVTSQDSECHKLTDIATFVHPYPNGEDLLVSQRNKLVKLNWKTKKVTVLDEVAPELKGQERFNEGQPDKSGRMWLATVTDSLTPGDHSVLPGKGNLWTWESGKGFTKRTDNFYLTNGITWSHDQKKLFINDSRARKIYVFDFDLDKGTVANKTILIDAETRTDWTVNDRPDGLTIDITGHLWASCIGNGRVVKIEPNSGDIVDTCAIPCPLTTTPVFGGPNMDQMFITTAYKNFGPDQRPAHPTCGKVHRITSDDKNFAGSVANRPNL
ncbi:unnamed protein product [Medioppia subpectinata]|uniref:SMP-30/Gluconolactonase/LRE-like region domain-containing protein n=1 Tax=Medioppia subpectinata TaxID=1979941 RepID=A0A7R9LAU7_9ACAR|nr:unnamed protein product [Medioppia subpectinata]CAG2116976.1 unnamed protein product [Medioppia subpectinata]